MIQFEPKYITFDCYGTLTRFRMAEMAREVYGERLSPVDLEAFVHAFAAYRLDEVLGAWKPYRDVVVNAIRRTCARVGVKFDEAEAESFYHAVPTWGPHPDVPAGLSRLAKQYKLVILSNASDDQIMSNVDKLGAPFHAVFTAQQAQSYKPRMQGFEYMFGKLGCKPEDVLHVSSSLRYDLMTAHDLGIKHKAFVNRGHEPGTPFYNYYEVSDIGHLATLLGL
ncbi:haloacid dehalogenase type II [Burkholderia multivorans]|uniref:haloacid dehalogenase type II n=1 Tax=Burkholderia multivorans TaxID=87883 RepID=UPI000D366BE5|nr:haloacid dehalogenase type II [Burkholderia multivorans]MBR8021799.1 haloacid dehalogenase type II [Burkholderia multivorans]MEB2512244.1 haloacid dehalogenase type II [Burkholderia multivorans]MEB2521546.1 haloacid dehalogenase type II [Burkholderia multivorans]MEB2575841.1 haloacid dehalogenase type II [Burkholderia multivorans]MEB2591517.1 haloacid dehalogenase type II [Burkholderia multivorans]